MRKSNRLVYGIGTKGVVYPAKVGNGGNIKEYALWNSMLFRCTQKLWNKRPTYTGTTCSENFKSYTFFYEWCQTQVGFGNVDENNKNWYLDKDILVRGNKHYSEDTCVFVPVRVNNLFIKSDKIRGEYPIGVCLDKSGCKFTVQCRNEQGSRGTLGRFNTAEEAFKSYKVFKEAYIKQVANEYKEQLDTRVYTALMNYEVDIED